MYFKKIKFILIIILLYQIPFNSKSNSFEKIRSENLAKYFSGIVAFNIEGPKTLINSILIGSINLI